MPITRENLLGPLLASVLSHGLMLIGVASAPVSASLAADVRCDKQWEPHVLEAIVEVQKLFDSMWLTQGGNHYTKFRKAGERPNPFDVQAKTETAKTLEGYIWVGALTCIVTRADSDALLRVRFEAGAISFREVGEGWTKPMLNRQLTEIVLTRSPTGWIAREDRGEYSVLLPDEQLLAPKADEVPKPDRRVGIPCQADYRWTGRSCARQK